MAFVDMGVDIDKAGPDAALEIDPARRDWTVGAWRNAGDFASRDGDVGKRKAVAVERPSNPGDSE